MIAGVDASNKEDTASAACVVMNQDLEIVDSASITFEARFPYIPEYFSCGEAPGATSVLPLRGAGCEETG